MLSLVALALSWHPRGGVGGALEVVALLVLGSAGCAGIGLLLAGRLRAEVNLAASNGLYLVLLLLSGIVVPVTSLPGFVQPRRRRGCPSGAMAEGLHRVLGQGLRPSTAPTGSRSRSGPCSRRSSPRARSASTNRPVQGADALGELCDVEIAPK